jgi:uncharacterized protein YndB with AHSA1/START domain
MAMHPCERVGLDFIAHPPFRFVSTVDLAIPAEQVFEILDDAESWPRWATAITEVTWTSPQPHGVGTTRTVYMRGGLVGDEEFLAWEPHSHLTWVMAMKPNGAAGRLGMALGRPVMARTFQKYLYNLRDYSARRYAAT